MEFPETNTQKDTLEEINSTLDTAEENLNKPEDTATEVIHN